MTDLHLIYLASIAGAILFFTAGATTIALRRAHAAAPVASLMAPSPEREAAIAEAARLHALVQTAQAENAQLRRALAERPPIGDERTTVGEPDLADAAELRTLRRRAEQAEAALAAARSRGDHTAAELATARTRAEQAETELAAARTREQQAETELAAARTREQQARADVERQRRALATAEATARASVDAAVRTSADAEARAQRLAADAERARDEASTATRELAHAQQRLRELEQQLAERAQTVRDLSTENEQLKGRVRDAEATHADYVRLRTAATDAELLQREIARLEQELRDLHIDALGAHRPRPAASAAPAGAPAERTISASLTGAIEQFADAGTRSVAVADVLGFPLASHGSDGVALAAYAALLMETALRARQFLPVAAPASIEVVDEHGARVALWTFDVDGDRLLLANLAVTPAEDARVGATLADLGRILAPTVPGRRQTG